MSEARQAAWAARKAERGSSRSCNPETEYSAGWDARGAEVAELKEMIASVERNCTGHAVEADAERDAALAVIERVLNLTGDIGPEARRILTQSPTDALAEHDRAVRAEAWDDGYGDPNGDPSIPRTNPYRKEGE